MRGIWQLAAILAVAGVLAGLGAYYYLFLQRDITAFISDDFDFAMYVQRKTSVFEQLPKYFIKENISVDFSKMLLIGSTESNQYAIIFENLLGELPLENYTKTEIGKYTLFCSDESVCEILRNNYKKPKKSELRDLLKSKRGDFSIVYRGYLEEFGNLKLAFGGESVGNLVKLDGDIITDNVTAAEELEKGINAIVGFVYFMGIKGVDIDVDREGGALKIKGTIDTQKVKESIEKLNLTMIQNITFPTTLPG